MATHRSLTDHLLDTLPDPKGPGICSVQKKGQLVKPGSALVMEHPCSLVLTLTGVRGGLRAKQSAVVVDRRRYCRTFGPLDSGKDRLTDQPTAGLVAAIYSADRLPVRLRDLFLVVWTLDGDRRRPHNSA